MNSEQPQKPVADILIVDDTPINLRLLSSILTRAGYEVRKALNGETALRAAQSSLPDLILLDIMMPDMDGYQVCQQLKSNTQTREVPVIFISALNTDWYKEKAYDVGGVGYITKPFKVEEILSCVEEILNNNLPKTST